MQLAIDWLTSYLGASPMQIEPYIIYTVESALCSQLAARETHHCCMNLKVKSY